MDYVDSLSNELNHTVIKTSERMANSKEGNAPQMSVLLKAALKNEWETVLVTSHWVIDEVDSDFRISLARLAGDEAKHFELIQKRLSALGEKVDQGQLNQRSPLTDYLLNQKTTLDRTITGPFCREALAVARNRVFLDYCDHVGDKATVEIYKTIQIDELHHHQLGTSYLRRLILTDADYRYAQKKMSELMAVVDDIQEILLIKRGLSYVPGC